MTRQRKRCSEMFYTPISLHDLCKLLRHPSVAQMPIDKAEDLADVIELAFDEKHPGQRRKVATDKRDAEAFAKHQEKSE